MRPEAELIVALTALDGDPRRVDRLLSGGLNWDYLLELAIRNRIDGLIFEALDRRPVLAPLPPRLRQGMEDSYRRTVINTEVHLRTAGEIAEAVRGRGIGLVVLRGPALGITVYEKPYLRPFSDLDLLVRTEDVPVARMELGRMGFIQPEGFLPERYFLRHHLHLRMDHKERGVIAELHWAFDHPYTLARVDYPGLFARATDSGWAGTMIPVLAPADSLATLCLHFFKHCPFLPALLREPDFLPLLLRGNWLLWLIDIHRQWMRMNDDERRKTWSRGEEWCIEDRIECCLEAVGRLYGPIPAEGGGERRRTRLSRLEQHVYRLQLKSLRGEGVGRVGRFLFRLRAESIFRPVRALDALKYGFPPAAWLRKEYAGQPGGPGWWRIRQALRALGRLIRNAADYAAGSLRGIKD